MCGWTRRSRRGWRGGWGEVRMLRNKLLIALSTAVAASCIAQACSRDTDDPVLVRGVVFRMSQGPVFYPSDGGDPTVVTAPMPPLFDEGTCVRGKFIFGTRRVLAPQYVRRGPPYVDRWQVERVAVGAEIVSFMPFAENRTDVRCRLPQLQRARGVYATADIETSDFQSLNSDETWWVERSRSQAAIDVSPRAKPHPRALPESYACVDALGVASPLGSYGHMGMGDRGLFIVELLWSAPHDGRNAAKCAFPTD